MPIPSPIPWYRQVSAETTADTIGGCRYHKCHASADVDTCRYYRRMVSADGIGDGIGIVSADADTMSVMYRPMPILSADGIGRYH